MDIIPGTVVLLTCYIGFQRKAYICDMFSSVSFCSQHCYCTSSTLVHLIYTCQKTLLFRKCVNYENEWYLVVTSNTSVRVPQSQAETLPQVWWSSVLSKMGWLALQFETSDHVSCKQPGRVRQRDSTNVSELKCEMAEKSEEVAIPGINNYCITKRDFDGCSWI